MFLFLSGYLTKCDIPNIKAFYTKRLKRILIPYCIWSVIYTCAYRNFSTFFFDLLTGRCCFAYYYILVYAQFVLLTPILGKLAKSRYYYAGYFVSPVAVLLTRYILPEYGIVVDTTFFFVWFNFYFMGMRLGNNLYSGKWRMGKIGVFYCIALLLSEAEGFFWYFNNNYDMATTQIRISSLIATFFALYLSAQYLQNADIHLPHKIKQILHSIGDASFAIYLSHPLIQRCIKHIPGSKMVSWFPMLFVLVLGVSYVCTIIGRKILGRRAYLLGLE